MSTIRDVTWANVLSWRMTRHHLAGPRAESVPDVVRRLTTVPAWPEDARTNKSLTFLKPLAWQGDLGLGPSNDGGVVLRALHGVAGFGGVPTSDEAGPRAILAYLDAYGPATAENLNYWFGEGLSAG